jgi:hypothetical protein
MVRASCRAGKSGCAQADGRGHQTHDTGTNRTSQSVTLNCRSAHVAEWILSLFTSRDRAESTVSDPLKKAAGRGALWFVPTGITALAYVVGGGVFSEGGGSLRIPVLSLRGFCFRYPCLQERYGLAKSRPPSEISPQFFKHLSA